MASDVNKTLLLTINATTELLRQNLQKSDEDIAKFAAKTEERLAIVDLAFERVGDKIAEHGAEIGGAIAGIFAVEAISEAIEKGLEYAASLGEVAKQLGVTARDLQVFRYAATQVGISTDEMDKGLQKFTKSLGTARAGSEETGKIFKAIGFTDDEIKHLDIHDALLKTADGIAAIGDRATRAVPETQLFGRAGQRLDTLFDGGAKGIEAFAAQAEKLGLIIPDEFLERAAKAEHTVSELKQVLSVNIASAVAQNADSITTLAHALEAVAVGAAHAVTRLTGFITIAKGEGFIAALAANGKEKDQAGTDPGNLQRQLVEFRDAQASYRRNPTSPSQSNYRDAIGRLKAAALQVSQDKAEEAAADKLAQEQGTGDGLGGVLAPKGPKGKSAAELAKEAEEARKREVDRQKRVADEDARLDDEYLGYRSSITANTYEQNVIARERLTAETAAKLADVDAQVADGRVKGGKDGPEATGLRDRINRNAAGSLDLINQRENVQDEQSSFALSNAQLDSLKDELSSQESLATTLKARRDLQLAVLAAEKENERKRLQAIADDASRPQADRRHSDEEIDEANNGLASIDQRYQGKAEVIGQQTASPIDAYKRDLQTSVGDTNTSLQGLGVEGVKGLEDSLVSISTSSANAKQALHSLFVSLLADLEKLALEKGILALIGAVGGGAASGSSSAGWDDGGYGATAGETAPTGSAWADGGLPGYAAGGAPSNDNGIIRGPGTGRSDSILAIVGGRKAIRVSNGEGIVNERAVQKYWPAIDAMNKGTFSKFANGGLVGAQAIIPASVPDMASIGAARQAAQAQTLRLALSVEPSDMFDVRAKQNAHEAIDERKPEIVSSSVAATADASRRRVISMSSR